MGVLCRVRPTGVSTALRDDDNTARAITVESGDSFVCEPSDTILRAALRAGFAFPYECNVGQCGSCRFELLKGEVEDLWPGAPALNERDRRKSRKLACQSRPISDCVIKVRADPDCAPLHITRSSSSTGPISSSRTAFSSSVPHSRPTVAPSHSSKPSIRSRPTTLPRRIVASWTS